MDAQVQQVLNAINKIPQQYQKQVMKLMQDYRVFTDEQCIQLKVMQEAVVIATHVAQQQQQPAPKAEKPKPKEEQKTEFTLAEFREMAGIQAEANITKIECLNPKNQYKWLDKKDQESPYTYDLQKPIHIQPFKLEKVQIKVTFNEGVSTSIYNFAINKRTHKLQCQQQHPQ